MLTRALWIKVLCSKNEITKTGTYIQKELKKRVSKIVFTEGIAFKHFLLANMTKFRGFFVKWKSFKDHNVYIINFFKRVITEKFN